MTHKYGKKLLREFLGVIYEANFLLNMFHLGTGIHFNLGQVPRSQGTFLLFHIHAFTLFCRHLFTCIL